MKKQTKKTLLELLMILIVMFTVWFLFSKNIYVLFVTLSLLTILGFVAELI